MACSTPFDILRSKSEELGPTLYVRASWKDPWLNLIPREEFEGYATNGTSAFTIQRSEPNTEEEEWTEIKSVADSGTPCANTWNDTFVGYKENKFKPEKFALRGPLVCVDDLVLNWKSIDFWEKYFAALEKRNVKSIVNRLSNVYMNYVPKAAGTSSDTFQYVDGDISTQPADTVVDLSALPTPDTTEYCDLQQGMLDDTASILQEEGADNPDTNGWITQGPNGAIFPLLIGQEASKRLLLQNAELREDYRFAAMGNMTDANPVIQRLGSSRVIGNFRHVITRFPARWHFNDGDGLFHRVSAFTMSTDASVVTKGKGAVVNPLWRDPAYAQFEAAIVLSPWVYHEQVLRPVTTAPGIKFQPQNYMGEWQFVTGNDAIINTSDSCTGITDPLHKYGRHFAEYRHANKPIYPEYGRMILFRRCAASFECIDCS